MYDVLKYVHVVCAVIWVGGAFYLQMLAIRVSGSDDPTEVPRLGRHIEALGNRVFVPAAALLLLSGLAMVSQRFSFDEAWIVAAIMLWVLSAVAGAVYMAPRAKRANELFEIEGPTSAAAHAIIGRLFLVSRLELVSFAIAIALMIYGPTH